MGNSHPKNAVKELQTSFYTALSGTKFPSMFSQALTCATQAGHLLDGQEYYSMFESTGDPPELLAFGPWGDGSAAFMKIEPLFTASTAVLKKSKSLTPDPQPLLQKFLRSLIDPEAVKPFFDEFSRTHPSRDMDNPDLLAFRLFRVTACVAALCMYYTSFFKSHRDEFVHFCEEFRAKNSDLLSAGFHVGSGACMAKVTCLEELVKEDKEPPKFNNLENWASNIVDLL